MCLTSWGHFKNRAFSFSVLGSNMKSSPGDYVPNVTRGDRAARKVQQVPSCNKLSMNKTLSRKRPVALWIGISVAVILLGGWFLTRTFVIAAYSIPTRSMEKTIHLGR